MSTTDARRHGLARRLAQGALVLPVSGTLLLLAAPSASAAVTSPGAGVTYTSPTTVGITADVPQSTTRSTLSLQSPDGGTRTLATAGSQDALGRYPSQTLRGSLDTDCASADCASGQMKPARNGTWTIRLAGADSDTRNFVVRIPPRRPTNVSSSLVTDREVSVRWTRGVEPDLTGFTLEDGNGNVLRTGIGMGACSGTSCSASVTYGEQDSGERQLRVKAHRSTSPGSSSVVDSSPSDTTRVTLAPRAQPTPSPTPSSSSSPTAGPTASPSGSPGTGGGTDPGTGGGGTDPGTGGGGTDPGTGGGGTDPGTGGGTDPGTGGSETDPGTGGASASPSGKPSSKPALGTGTKSDNAAIAQRKAFALTFRSFAPKLGLNKLPPLPRVQAPQVGEVPLPDGTFESELDYGDQELQEKVEILGSKRLGGAVTGALDSTQLMRFIAISLVLMLTAAHLRRWLGSTRDALE